jgi:nucleoside-diphosphate-sugar epimerase
MTIKRKQETILVTGASGTVGSEVVKQLSRNGHAVHIKSAVHSLHLILSLKQKRMRLDIL